MTKRHLLFAAKMTLACGSLAFVFSQIDLQQMLTHLNNADPFLLALGTAALLLGQTISGLRMWYYSASEGYQLPKGVAIRLYFIGTFFNQMLPGGIGGDGYKIYLLAKEHGVPKWLAFKRMISNRASGLLWLIVLAGVLGYFSTLIYTMPFGFWLNTAGIILVFPCYVIAVRVLLKESLKQAVGAMPYSFAVQALCIITSLCLLFAMHIEVESQTLVDYLVLFLISSIVSILPISVGGAGLRELTFLAGAKVIGMNPELGVAFSLLYFVINFVISLPGGYFFLKRKDHRIPQEV
jgi:uncharacterized membrane protein YbhN (UPF0104 family)